MNTLSRPLLFSVKPNYAGLIFEGFKKVELRKRISSRMENRYVFVYVSSPARQLRGGFRVGKVWSGTPREIWDKISGLSQVTKQYFDIYYEGRNIAYALEITDVWEYENPADLENLRERFPDFVVPQSWRSLKPEEQTVFEDMKRKRGICPSSVITSQPDTGMVGPNR